MNVTFERVPFGWAHPFHHHHRQHRPQRPRHCFNDWDDFERSPLGPMSTLGQLIQMSEPYVFHHLAAQKKKEEKQEKFELNLDVQHFKSEELDVKMVGNCVVVEGKHEEKEDAKGHISRHFVRRYQLPDDVKPETVTCNLGADGILRIAAPRMIEQKPESERSVPISVTNQPNEAEKGKEENKAEDTKPEDTNNPETMKEAST